jgi:hypothetical protein
VLWRAGSTAAAAAAAAVGPAGSSNGGKWQCFENACPHRCVWENSSSCICGPLP